MTRSTHYHRLVQLHCQRERDNDENLVIVDDPNLARAYLEEFQRVYAQALAPTRCR